MRITACRNDASLAASELALALEARVLATGSEDTVGTVGSWRVEPNAVNSVPRVVELGIDIRDINASRRDGVVAGITADAKDIAARRKVLTITIASTLHVL